MARRTTSGRVIGFGDPVLDVVSSVSFETLENLNMEAGGCTSIAASELECLLSLEEISTGLLKVPGGSAANVTKCLAGLRSANPDENEVEVSFLGMVGQDQAGAEYKSMLELHGVKPVLPKCESKDASTAACLCLISPDGQRTMRTYLGAAQQFTSADQIPEDLGVENAGLCHFEGYSLYKPVVTEAAMTAARAAGSKVSLDLASFEVVQGCWKVLKRLLAARLVDIVFCNEDEARAVCLAGNLLQEGAEIEADEAVELAQKYILEFVELAIMTRGKEGCVVATADGQKAAAPGEDVVVVDTVGAGDFFSAGFLHAWISGAPLAACAACGCAAGGAAVQAAGADLGVDGMKQLRKKVDNILNKS